MTRVLLLVPPPQSALKDVLDALDLRRAGRVDLQALRYVCLFTEIVRPFVMSL